MGCRRPPIWREHSFIGSPAVLPQARLHAMLAEHLGDRVDEADVVVGIETDRGPWVQALIAAAHKGLIWERTRHLLRPRSTLREFYPAALLAFDNLNATDALEPLAAAPDPTSAAALSVEAIEAALKRVLAEFGGDKNRYADAKARKNYAGTSPITRASGIKKVVLARHVHNDRLVDALGLQAFAALRASPGVRAYYDQLRARGVGHRAALRQVGNRLVGILHGWP